MTFDDLRSPNLVFLLGLAPLNAACIINTGGGDDGASSVTSPSSGDPTTGSPGTTDDSADDDGSAGGTSMSTSGDATGGTTTTATDTTAGADSTGGAVHPCQLLSDKNVECYGEDNTDTYQQCVELLDYIESALGQKCVDLYDTYLVCLSEISCREFMGADPCPREGLAFDTACGT